MMDRVFVPGGADPCIGVSGLPTESEEEADEKVDGPFDMAGIVASPVPVVREPSLAGYANMDLAYPVADHIMGMGEQGLRFAMVDEQGGRLLAAGFGSA